MNIQKLIPLMWLASFSAFGVVRELPIKLITPGESNPAVTQKNIATTICVAGFTSTIRPNTNVTGKIKIQSMKDYGYQQLNIRDFELDHLIALTLGGHPSSVKNLWPQPWVSTRDARNKDRLEVYLNKQVCSKKIPLITAQKMMSGNWIDAYNQIFGK